MTRLALVLLLALAGLVAACGGTTDEPGPKVTPPPGVEPVASLGEPEGRLRLLAPPGYDVESATAAPACRTRIDVARTPDELVRRFSAGGYDGVLGNGDVTVRLIAAGAIAPINTELVPNYADVVEGLQEQPFNSVGGQLFALPVGRAAHMLVWRRSKIPGTLGGLGAILDPPQIGALGQQITVPDDPAGIAQAALWVARQRKDLEFTDPYELDRRQFAAVLQILRLQEPYVSEYWDDPDDVVAAFRSNRAAAGMAPQSAVADLRAAPGPGGPIEATMPKEGSLGISPAWMVAADARHPSCMYAWMNAALDPDDNAQLAQRAQIAPANRRACELIPEHCERFHAEDEDFYRKVLFRTTPSADCGDERGRVCMDSEDWARAWRSVTGP